MTTLQLAFAQLFAPTFAALAIGWLVGLRYLIPPAQKPVRVTVKRRRPE